ncbi:hypothetical protein CPHO_01850 [Corynebacterium phocae]|uniref:SpaA-like prealbumin fold domain-containing protein n=1 Tax=Corynebacterium phocae TaxID=161895 RepID=A0A1L7D134_9CORY|nr:hypothetical protein CPHO_01850 [Corynebacterium phocae]
MQTVPDLDQASEKANGVTVDDSSDVITPTDDASARTSEAPNESVVSADGDSAGESANGNIVSGPQAKFSVETLSYDDDAKLYTRKLSGVIEDETGLNHPMEVLVIHKLGSNDVVSGIKEATYDGKTASGTTFEARSAAESQELLGLGEEEAKFKQFLQIFPDKTDESDSLNGKKFSITYTVGSEEPDAHWSLIPTAVDDQPEIRSGNGIDVVAGKVPPAAAPPLEGYEDFNAPANPKNFLINNLEIAKEVFNQRETHGGVESQTGMGVNRTPAFDLGPQKPVPGYSVPDGYAVSWPEGSQTLGVGESFFNPHWCLAYYKGNSYYKNKIKYSSYQDLNGATRLCTRNNNLEQGRFFSREHVSKLESHSRQEGRTVRSESFTIGGAFGGPLYGFEFGSLRSRNSQGSLRNHYSTPIQPRLVRDSRDAVRIQIKGILDTKDWQFHNIPDASWDGYLLVSPDKKFGVGVTGTGPTNVNKVGIIQVRFFNKAGVDKLLNRDNGPDNPKYREGLQIPANTPMKISYATQEAGVDLRSKQDSDMTLHGGFEPYTNVSKPPKVKPAPLKLVKTPAAPSDTGENEGKTEFTYGIVVDNNTPPAGTKPIDRTFQLFDLPDFTRGLVIKKRVVVLPNGKEIEFGNYISGKGYYLPSGENDFTHRISAGEVQTIQVKIYTYGVTAENPQGANLRCENGAPKKGAYNAARLESEGLEPLTSNTCIDVQPLPPVAPPPVPQLDKNWLENVKYSQGGDGQYRASYILTIDNTAPRAIDRDLNVFDTPSFSATSVKSVTSVWARNGVVSSTGETVFGQEYSLRGRSDGVNLNGSEIKVTDEHSNIWHVPAGKVVKKKIDVYYYAANAQRTDSSYTCNGNPGNGAYNSASFTLDNEVRRASDCGDFLKPDSPKPVISKTPLGVTDTENFPEGKTLKYSVTLENRAVEAQDFEVVDIPEFTEKVNVLRVRIQDSVNGNPSGPKRTSEQLEEGNRLSGKYRIADAGKNTWTVPGQSRGQKFVYVDISYSLNAPAGSGDYRCLGAPQFTARNGGFNTAKVKSGAEWLSASTCQNIEAPAVPPTITKTNKGVTDTPNSDTKTAEFDISLRNNDPAPRDFIVYDKPDFTDNVQIRNVFVQELRDNGTGVLAPAGAKTKLGELQGQGDKTYRISDVRSETWGIGGNQTEHRRVYVEFVYASNVDARRGTFSCGTVPTPNNGGFNKVSVRKSGDSGVEITSDNACADIPSPKATVQKRNVEITDNAEVPGHKSAVYQVVVTNPDLKARRFEVSDAPLFTDDVDIHGMEIQNAAVNGGQYVAVGSRWTANKQIAGGETIYKITDPNQDAWTVPAGETAVKFVYVDFTYGRSALSQNNKLTCSRPLSPKNGALNKVVLRYQDGGNTVETDPAFACLDIESPKQPVISKKFLRVQPVPGKPGSMRAVYNVILSNNDQTYDFEVQDTPDFTKKVEISGFSVQDYNQRQDGSLMLVGSPRNVNPEVGNPRSYRLSDSNSDRWRVPRGQRSAKQIVIEFTYKDNPEALEGSFSCSSVKAPGNGAFNRVSVTSNLVPGAAPIAASDCGKIPYNKPQITKDPRGFEKIPGKTDGEMAVYDISVTNPGPAAEFEVFDVPDFTKKVAIDNVYIQDLVTDGSGAVSTVGEKRLVRSEQSNGETRYRLTDENQRTWGIDEDGTESKRIFVEFSHINNLTADNTGEYRCQQGDVAGNGGYNKVKIKYNIANLNKWTETSACQDLDEPSLEPFISKTPVGLVDVPGSPGVKTAVYDIALRSKTQFVQYTLLDYPKFSENVRIREVRVQKLDNSRQPVGTAWAVTTKEAKPEAGVTGDPEGSYRIGDSDTFSNILIESPDTIYRRVYVDFEYLDNPAVPSSYTCSATPEPSNGAYNEVHIVKPKTAQSHKSSACIDIPTPPEPLEVAIKKFGYGDEETPVTTDDWDFALYKLKGESFDSDQPIRLLPGLTDGQKRFEKSLAAGEYLLVETKAPDGFELLAEPVKLRVSQSANSSGAPAELVLSLAEPNIAVDLDGTIIKVFDVHKGELPESGGLGVYWMLILGALLLSVVGVSRRKSFAG